MLQCTTSALLHVLAHIHTSLCLISCLAFVEYWRWMTRILDVAGGKSTEQQKALLSTVGGS